MEPHPRATSSVYSASFDLDTLLEQITAQTQGHQRGENDQLPKSYGVARSWEQRATVENTALPESCQIDQTLEQQLIMQNAELRDRLDRARGRFARLYNAMKKAMEVSRELYEIHLNVAHENDEEQKEHRASGEYF